MTLKTVDADHIGNLFARGAVEEAIRELFLQLYEARNQLPAAAWRDTIAALRLHPVAALLYQDPITSSAYEKKRGYPGAADVIDHLYGLQPNGEELSAMGRAINQLNFNSEAARAVRVRLERLAVTVDAVCQAAARPARVLSVACGHLREAALSRAYADGSVAEWVAIDQDPLSLELIAGLHGHRGIVHPACVSVRDILKSTAPLEGTFDLIYAAGLLDYLPQPMAKALTEKLFAMLSEGGKLLTANFLPDIANVGYMEAFMDWWLIYRSQDELVATAAGLPPGSHALQSDADELKNIVYLTVQKV